MAPMNTNGSTRLSPWFGTSQETKGNSSWWFSSGRSFRATSRSLSRKTRQISCNIKCVEALKVQVIVVRNVAGSIACAWIATACYSLGNILPMKPAWILGREELVVANSVWAIITFCTVVYMSFIPFLLSLRFRQSPDQRPTIWFCLTRLARSTIVYFVVAVVTMLGFGYLAAYMSAMNFGTFNYKVESYADNLVLMGYFTGITRAVKKIYYEESCQGFARLQEKQKKILIISSRRSSIVSPQLETSVFPPRYHTASFWRAYIRIIPTSIPSLMATAFVHMLSRQGIVNRGTAIVTGFIVGSIAFKLIIQEVAKHYVLKKHVRSIRVMCVLVGIPTVLIDTQARIILLGKSSKRIAVLGALGMACIEVLLRVGKAKYVIWSISQRENILVSKTAASLFQFSAKNVHQQELNMYSQSPLSLPRIHKDFEVWKRQVQAFHTAELNADMYAEYIAIGCSAAILFFYAGHPHYPLLRQSESATVETDVVAWRTNQLYMLVFQMVIELVVDYVSIFLEMMIGIEYDHVKHLRSFLAALFMVTAVMNITISICIYLS